MKTIFLVAYLCVGSWEEHKCGVSNQMPVVATDSLDMCMKLMALNQSQAPGLRMDCVETLPLGTGLGYFGKRRD